jgi:dTMP kinase
MDQTVETQVSTSSAGKADRTNEARGKFITLEGGEGAGKSTQAQMLAQHLESFGLGVLLTREPGGSPGAEVVRHILLSGAAKPLGAETEAVLFAAARQDHVRCAIEPALAAGKWVVCDRFADSTRVYQGALGKVDARFIRGLEWVSIGGLAPDVTLVLDLPVEEGLKRLASRRGNSKPDRFEAEDPEFHQKLRSAYLALARQESERCIVIDANRSIKKIAKQIWSVVESRLDPAAVLAAAKKSASRH